MGNPYYYIAGFIILISASIISTIIYIYLEYKDIIKEDNTISKKDMIKKAIKITLLKAFNR